MTHYAMSQETIFSIFAPSFDTFDSIVTSRLDEEKITNLECSRDF